MRARLDAAVRGSAGRDLDLLQQARVRALRTAPPRVKRLPPRARREGCALLTASRISACRTAASDGSRPLLAQRWAVGVSGFAGQIVEDGKAHSTSLILARQEQ
jgi:hypothetical protein